MVEAEIKIVSDLVDHSKTLINGHSYTVGWLLDSLRKNDKIYQKLHGNQPVKEVTAPDVSGGKGILSKLLRCKIIFIQNDDDIQSDNNFDFYTTILKIPGFDFFKDDDFLTEDMKIKFTVFHKLECDFYNHLAPILDGPTPKVYKTMEWILDKQEGCVHMEDMTQRGKTLCYFENINLTQVKCIIQHLAHMHKNILCADPKLWKGKYIDKSNGFVDFLDIHNNAVEPFLERTKNADAFRPYINKYHKLCRNKEFYVYAYKQAHKDLGMLSVINHGDMHSGNIMWAIDKDGNIQNEVAAIVDWQTMHEGSPMSDLARFIVHCADGNIRRQAETFMIELYFECLIKEFDDGENIQNVPYTLDQLKKAYNYAFVTQALYTIGVMELFVPNLETNFKDNENFKNDFLEFGALKSLHAFEDVDRLLQGEMKDIFEKYGKLNLFL